MTSHPIEALVTARVALTEDEADAIIGLAYLAISIDGDTNDEESAAFRAVVVKLRSAIGAVETPYRGGHAQRGALTDADHLALLDRMQAEIEHVTFEERLGTLADRLKRLPSRQLAYRIVYALDVCDLAVNRQEAALERDLASALSLDEDEVAALVEDVSRTLSLASE